MYTSISQLKRNAHANARVHINDNDKCKANAKVNANVNYKHNSNANSNAKSNAKSNANSAWLYERSPFHGEPWFKKRVEELEEGASIVASEECSERGPNEADPELCLAARMGKAKRTARRAAINLARTRKANALREAKLKENTRKAIANREANERWANAKGPLIAMAAQHANTANNLRAVYNGPKNNNNNAIKKKNLNT